MFILQINQILVKTLIKYLINFFIGNKKNKKNKVNVNLFKTEICRFRQVSCFLAFFAES